MNLGTMHGDRLDKHVRHIAEIERHIHLPALAFQLYQLRFAPRISGNMKKQPHTGVFMIAVHPQLERLARSVFRLVGNQLQRTKLPRRRIFPARPVHIENHRTVHRLALTGGHASGYPVLARHRCGKLVADFPLDI